MKQPDISICLVQMAKYLGLLSEMEEFVKEIGGTPGDRATLFGRATGQALEGVGMTRDGLVKLAAIRLVGPGSEHPHDWGSLPAEDKEALKKMGLWPFDE